MTAHGIHRMLGLGLLLALFAGGGGAGCALLTPGETSKFQAAGVAYQATGGIEIIAIEGGQIVYRVTCPVCGYVTERRNVAAPGMGESWEGEYDCPDCFYSGTIKITAHN